MICTMLLSIALAGEPTQAPIPWDSVWIDTTPPGDTGLMLQGYWIAFVTRDAYEAAVQGKTKSNLADIKKDLDKLKELLKQEVAASEAEKK